MAHRLYESSVPMGKAGRQQQADFRAQEGYSEFFQTAEKYWVLDTLQSIKDTGIAGGTLPPGTFKTVSHKGIGKIYSFLLRTSGAGGDNVGAQIEIDNIRYDFQTMAGLRARGAISNQDRLAWLSRDDTLANQFTMVFTPSKELTYYGEYILYLVNLGVGEATLVELEVYRIVLKDL